MRLKTLCLSAILASACVVDDIAAERDRSSDDRLVEQASVLCKDSCARLDACASVDCECEPAAEGAPEAEPCECPEPPEPDCVDQCGAWFENFTQRGDACSDVAFSFLECVAAIQTCGDPEAVSDCGLEPSFEPVCNGGKVHCQLGGGRYTTTGGGDSGIPLRTTSCSFELTECGDERAYAVYCAEQGNSLGCVCQLDGETGATFEPENLNCGYSQVQLGQLCGWNALLP